MNPDKTEKVIFNKPGVLVKNTGDYPFERPFTSTIYVEFGEGSEDSDYLFMTGSGIPMVYPVASDAIRGSEEEGKIEFSSYGNEYVLRNFIEEDSEWFTGFGLPLSPQMMEEIVAKDETVGVEQSVEALTDASGEMIGILYIVENLGVFSRIDGEWKAGAVEGAEQREEDDEITSTPIKYSKAKELVERFDAGETITEEELDKDYADEAAETEEDE